MKLPTSPVRMNIVDMRLRLGDDEVLIADLLALFLEDCEPRLAAIDAGVAARRLDSVRRDAHALKSSAGNLSAVGVVEAAAELESMAERGDTKNLDVQFAKLAAEVELLVAEIRGIPPGSA